MKVKFLCESYRDLDVAEKRTSAFFQKFFLNIFDEHTDSEIERTGLGRNLCSDSSATKFMVFDDERAKISEANYSINVKLYASQEDAIKSNVALATKIEKAISSKFKNVKKVGSSKKSDFAIHNLTFFRGKQKYKATLRFTFKPSNYASVFVEVFQVEDISEDLYLDEDFSNLTFEDIPDFDVLFFDLEINLKARHRMRNVIKKDFVKSDRLQISLKDKENPVEILITSRDGKNFHTKDLSKYGNFENILDTWKNLDELTDYIASLIKKAV